MDINERLKHAREEIAGFKSATAAAKALGIPYPTYAGHENGAKGAFRREDAVRYAKFFRVSLEWLLTGAGDPRKGKVPVVGYVGAGAEVFPIDDYPKGRGMEQVESPPGAPRDVVAVAIRGESMHPLGDGWLLFYRRDQDGVPDDCVNRLCVVQVHAGPTLVKTLKNGQKPRLWTLESWNAPTRENVRLTWAARVIHITPR